MTTKSDQLYKEFTGAAAYRPKMTYQQFLDRNGVRLGLPDFSQVPYYLLIVGDPRQVKFKFQYGLDMTYAVGRLHFDTPEEYARLMPARSSNPRPSRGAPASRGGSAFRD